MKFDMARKVGERWDLGSPAWGCVEGGRSKLYGRGGVCEPSLFTSLK